LALLALVVARPIALTAVVAAALTAMVATGPAVVVALTRRPVLAAAMVVTGLLVLPPAAGLVRHGRGAHAERDGDQGRDGEEGERTPIEAVSQQRDHGPGR
jgi:hypothetical protein